MIDDFQKDPKLLTVVGDMDYKLVETETVCIFAGGFNIYIEHRGGREVQIRVYRDDDEGDVPPCAILTVNEKGEQYG